MLNRSTNVELASNGIWNKRRMMKKKIIKIIADGFKYGNSDEEIAEEILRLFHVTANGWVYTKYPYQKL